MEYACLLHTVKEQTLKKNKYSDTECCISNFCRYTDRSLGRVLGGLECSLH